MSEAVAPLSFGTDGWRARVETADGFTDENVRRVAGSLVAALEDLERDPALPVIVGYDTRRGSRAAAEIAAETIAGAGRRALLATVPAPTPAFGYGVVRSRAAAALVVTASHNGPEWNGIKIKDADGGPPREDLARALERALRRDDPTSRREPAERPSPGSMLETFDPVRPYLAHLESRFDFAAWREHKLSVVFDAMHGAAGRLFETLLLRHGVPCTTLRGLPDPDFGGVHPEPVPEALEELATRVTWSQQGVTFGLATDGDGDRSALVLPDGQIATSAFQFLFLVDFLGARVRKLPRRLAKTVSLTDRVRKAADHFGFFVTETPVGFPHLAAAIRGGDVVLAGEESGGFGTSQYHPDRDGLFAGALTLEAAACGGETPLPERFDRILDRYGRSETGRVDLPCPRVDPVALLARIVALGSEEPGGVDFAGRRPESIETRDGVKLRFGPLDWVLFRAARTEPLVRIYAESPTAAGLARTLGHGKKLVTRMESACAGSDVRAIR